MFLVHRGPLRPTERGREGRIRLFRRQGSKSILRGCVHRSNRTCRVDPDNLQSQTNLLQRYPTDLLHDARSDYSESSRSRCGNPVQIGSLLPQPEQEAIAKEVIKETNSAKLWKKPIVTEVVPFKAFYKAEDYHQEYFKNNSRQPYCQVVIAPKIVKLREHYREKLKNA